MGNRKESTNSGPDLHAAARTGDLIGVQTICTSNPLAVNSRDKLSRTPLHLAAWSGHAQVVSFLCKNKADVGAAAMDDMGAIHFASQKGHLEVVRTLLSSGVSVKSCNRKGMTALHYAAQGSNLELVKYLVKKGSNLSAKNKAGKSPLDLASSEDIRSFLVECESVPESNAVDSEQKAEETKPQLSNEKVECSETEAAVPQPEEADHENDESSKRKYDNSKENATSPKKAKIALNHLLASDDTHEEED